MTSLRGFGLSRGKDGKMEVMGLTGIHTYRSNQRLYGIDCYSLSFEEAFDILPERFDRNFVLITELSSSFNPRKEDEELKEIRVKFKKVDKMYILEPHNIQKLKEFGQYNLEIHTSDQVVQEDDIKKLKFNPHKVPHVELHTDFCYSSHDDLIVTIISKNKKDIDKVVAYLVERLFNKKVKNIKFKKIKAFEKLISGPYGVSISNEINKQGNTLRVVCFLGNNVGEGEIEKLQKQFTLSYNLKTKKWNVSRLKDIRFCEVCKQTKDEKLAGTCWHCDKWICKECRVIFQKVNFCPVCAEKEKERKKINLKDLIYEILPFKDKRLKLAYGLFLIALILILICFIIIS